MIWAIVLIVPVTSAVIAYAWAWSRHADDPAPFDPTGIDSDTAPLTTAAD